MVELRRSSWLFLILPIFFVLSGCSRLSELTPESLHEAHDKWTASLTSNYRMVIETKGDRLESSKYEVTVRGKQVVELRRNGGMVRPGGGGQDYSVEGLFHLMDQEIDLAGKPGLLGAPPGYRSYPFARFDDTTGRLLRFQRSVGGTRNSIEITVTEFEVLPP